MRVYTWARGRIDATYRAFPTPRKGLSKQRVLALIALGFVLVIVLLVYFLRDHLDLTDVGYPAIALLSLFASAGLVVPVPGMAAVCAGGWLLNPWLVALVAGSTGTVGELTGYVLGFSGRGVVNRGRLYMRMENWMRRRGWLVIFLLSVLPNPVFDLAGISAGVLHYPIWRFLGLVWVGTFMKFLIVSYACAYSVESIIKLFGIDN
jgi:membrane protein YqaA with SNARE-associated domain